MRHHFMWILSGLIAVSLGAGGAEAANFKSSSSTNRAEKRTVKTKSTAPQMNRESKPSPPLEAAGFGISMETYSFTDLITSEVFPTQSLYLPMEWESFRIEPSFGMASFSSTSEDEVTGEETDQHRTFLRIDLGLARLWRWENGLVSFGCRGGVVSSSYLAEEIEYDSDYNERTVENESRRTGLVIAPFVGGEALLAPQFSLGAEFRLERIALGAAKGDLSSSDEKATYTNWRSSALLFARWYFHLKALAPSANPPTPAVASAAATAPAPATAVPAEVVPAPMGAAVP